MNKFEHGQVHHFSGLIALSVCGYERLAPTVYLTEGEAASLGEVLLRFAVARGEAMPAVCVEAGGVAT